MPFFFSPSRLLFYFLLVSKEKALRISGICYTGVKPVLLTALWTFTCITQLGTDRVDRNIQGRNHCNLWQKGTMKSSGQSFANIGLFPIVYRSTSALNSLSENEEEASEVNSRRWRNSPEGGTGGLRGSRVACAATTMKDGQRPSLRPADCNRIIASWNISAFSVY